LNFVSRGKEEHFVLEVMSLHVYSLYIMRAGNGVLISSEISIC